MTKDPSQSWLTREQLNRLIERTQHADCRERCSRKWRRSRQALRERARSDAALAPRPAGASAQPTTTAPDYRVDIEFTGRPGVEALLDFRLQPGKLLAATLLMQDRCDDCGFAAAIGTLAHLRGHKFFQSGWEFQGGD